MELERNHVPALMGGSFYTSGAASRYWRWLGINGNRAAAHSVNGPLSITA